MMIYLLVQEPPFEVRASALGRPQMIQCRVCRRFKTELGSREGRAASDHDAARVSRKIPFVEFELHRRLVLKMRMLGTLFIFLIPNIICGCVFFDYNITGFSTYCTSNVFFQGWTRHSLHDRICTSEQTFSSVFSKPRRWSSLRCQSHRHAPIQSNDVSAASAPCSANACV